MATTGSAGTRACGSHWAIRILPYAPFHQNLVNGTCRRAQFNLLYYVLAKLLYLYVPGSAKDYPALVAMIGDTYK